MPPKPELTILMIGEPRTGKSSMLAAMLKSMAEIADSTGITFAADEDTTKKMETRLSQLEKIFTLYKGREEFVTREGHAGELGDYSMRTADSTKYSFKMTLGDDTRNAFTIHFIDIPGEMMRQREIMDMVAKSDILMIAVDSPVLMEERRSKERAGHLQIQQNVSDDLLFTLMQSSFLNDSKDGSNASREKMLLFVPIKCEAYYYAGQMADLDETIKIAYRNSITYMEASNRCTVAITPILTLGDVVFKRYDVVLLPNGNRQINTTTPCYFSFRTRPGETEPSYHPQFCEQPLVYVISFLLATIQKNPDNNSAEFKAGFWAYVAAFLAGGVAGVIALFFATMIINNRENKERMFSFAYRLKTEEDGYTILYDPVGVATVCDTAEVAAQSDAADATAVCDTDQQE